MNGRFIKIGNRRWSVNHIFEVREETGPQRVTVYFDVPTFDNGEHWEETLTGDDAKRFLDALDALTFYA